MTGLIVFCVSAACFLLWLKWGSVANENDEFFGRSSKWTYIVDFFLLFVPIVGILKAMALVVVWALS